MPWNVERSDSCPASEPYAVMGPNGKVGCHPTREAAQRQVAALYANVAEAMLVEHPAPGHIQDRHGRRQPGTLASYKNAPKSDSAKMHSAAGGGFTDERAAFHETVVAEKLSGLPKSDEPTLYMTGGGAASGKTKGLLENPETGIPGPDKAAHIDPDGMKTTIPEYQAAVASGKPWAAAYAHEESSHMAKLGVHRALSSGHDVVYDSVGDNGIESLQSKVESFRARGAKRVDASYATVSTEVAISRARERGARTGRFVPESEIRRQHADVSRTFVAATERGVFDSARLFDTSGDSPTLVATYDRTTGLRVENPTLWDAFVAKGSGG